MKTLSRAETDHLGDAILDASAAGFDRFCLRCLRGYHGAGACPHCPTSGGPGSETDTEKALYQLREAIPYLAPNATGLSHAMGLIIRAAAAVERDPGFVIVKIAREDAEHARDNWLSPGSPTHSRFSNACAAALAVQR